MIERKDCNHIYGFYEGYSDSFDDDYESPRLVEMNSDYTVDIKFNFCPLCGEKLE